MANAFLFVVVSIGAALILMCGALMRHFGLEPDSYPGVLFIAIVLSLVFTYLIAKRVHEFIQRRLRR